jgi:hypothetical protein
MKKFTEKIEELNRNGLDKRKPRDWKTAKQDIKHCMWSKNMIRIRSDDGTLWMPHAPPRRNRNE